MESPSPAPIPSATTMLPTRRPIRSSRLFVVCMAVLLVAGTGLASGPLLAQEATPDVDCAAILTPEEEARLLALDTDAFDQDMDGGWRPIAQAGCFEEAAELIDMYVEAHPELVAPDSRDRPIFRFHAGQLYAFAGRTELAIERFEDSHEPEELIALLEQDPDSERAAAALRSWNAYVDATLAFLHQDREALERARERVAQGPVFGDEPMNLSVVDRLIAGFGGSYREAYTETSKDR